MQSTMKNIVIKMAIIDQICFLRCGPADGAVVFWKSGFI